jgi:hypothetical protein
MPVEDDTFGDVIIDGVRLDASKLRLLMAQSTLPHLAERVAHTQCDGCGRSDTTSHEEPFEPRVGHHCQHCGSPLRIRGRMKKVVLNSAARTLEQLEAHAVRPRVVHKIGMLPETI